MNQRKRTSKAAALMGIFCLTSASGCFIPTWRIPTPSACQKAEDCWGDRVDCICHHSPIDTPWCDPHYVKEGFYRVAADGIRYPEPNSDPPEVNLGDLKPPMYDPKGPMLPIPE